MKIADRTAFAGALEDCRKTLHESELHRYELELSGAGSGAMARYATLEGRPARRPVDLCELVLAMEQQVETLLGPETRFEFCAGSGNWVVNCDPLLMQIALLNIVLNARDAMEGCGTLRIDIQQVSVSGLSGVGRIECSLFVQVSVSDTGPGVPDTYANRVLEPYKPPKGRRRGAGLGLSQLRSFVDEAGGFVRQSSRKGVGTTVTIYLPVAA